MRIALLPVLALTVFTVAQAQNLPSGVQKMASLGGITEYDFRNGLRGLLIPDASNPKVTVNMTWTGRLLGRHHELAHEMFSQTPICPGHLT